MVNVECYLAGLNWFWSVLNNKRKMLKSSNAESPY